MKQSDPRVSIIILNWNGLKDTMECLQSLKKITYSNYEVILVDNGSKNDEAKILKEKFGNYISLIESKANVGFAEGNNIGIRQAIKDRADFVLCLNNDVIVEPDFLDKAVGVALLNKVDMVACKILNFFDRKKINAVWSSVYRSGLFVGEGYDKNDVKQFDSTKYVFGPSGCCGLYSLKLLKDIAVDNSFFDTDLFAYHEDIDLAFRAQWSGWKCVYAPKAIVYHKHSRSLNNNLSKKLFLTNKNNLNVWVKDFPINTLFLYSPFLFFRQFALNFYYFFQSPFAIIKSQYCAFRELPLYLNKRKIVFQKSRVSSAYIKSILK